MDPGNAISGSLPFRPSPTPYQWECIRPIFEMLYAKQQWSLSDVIKELQKFGIFASESAFKRKITAWKLDKKSKEAEMLAIIRKSRETASQGRQRSYSIRRRSVTLDDAYHYFERKGIRREVWNEREIPYAKTPKDIKSFSSSEASTPLTPSGSSTGSDLELAGRLLADFAERKVTDEFPTVDSDITPLSSVPSRTYLDKAAENFLLSVNTYFPYKFQSGEWILGATEYDIDAFYPSMQFGSLFLTYHNKRRLKDYPEAQTTLRSAFGMVDELLRVQDLRLLIYFLESLVFCRASGYKELANSINVFFMNRAKKIFGLQHPITVFCAGLLHADQAAREGFIELGLKSMLSQFRIYVQQPYDLETMRLLLTGAMILKHQGSYRTALEFLDQLLPMYQQNYGQNSYQTVHCLIDKAHIVISLKDYVEAQSLILVAMRCTEGIEDARELAESRVRCLVCLAVLREMEGNSLQKKAQLELAIGVGREMSLSDDHWMMTDLRARMS